MKFKHSVIYNKKLYRAGEEVPISEKNEVKKTSSAKKKKPKAEESETETSGGSENTGDDVSDS